MRGLAEGAPEASKPKRKGLFAKLNPKFGKITKGKTPALRTPETNVDSELGPQDTVQGYTAPPFDEQLEAELVKNRFKYSASRRFILERSWLRALAFENGNQWAYWKGSSLANLADEADPNANFVTFNMIEPLMLSIMARVTMSKPDVGVVALTDTPIDHQAADMCRAILSHEDRRLRNQIQTLELVHHATTTTAAWGYIYWDEQAEVDRPIYDQDTGQLLGGEKAKLGAPQIRITPGTSVYIDPKAERIEDANWIIVHYLESLDWVQRHYPDRGWDVRPGWDSSYDWYLQSYIQAITGDFAAMPSEQFRKDTVAILDCWERPSERYPKGRRIMEAGGILLEYSDWPEQRVDHSGRLAFPLMRLAYKETLNSPYSQGLVEKLIDLQYRYNVTWSRIFDHMDNEKLLVVVDRGAEIGIDPFSSPRNMQIVYKQPGKELVTTQAPPINEYWLAVLDKIWEAMQTIAGVHPVSQGQVPGGASGALAIELLQQSDASQTASFSAQIEQYQIERADWLIYLYAKYADEPRLLTVSDASNPQENLARVHSFEALREGGQARTYCTPGSALPKTPMAQRQEIDQWYSEGKLGQPGMPSTIATYFKLIGDTRADDIVESAAQSVAEALQAQAANQPNPLAIAEQKAQMDLQSSTAAKQVDATLYKEKVALDTQSKLTQIQAETSAKMALAQQQNDANMLSQLHDKAIPTVSLTGKMDPAAVEAEERRLGIAGDAKSAMPPPAAVAPPNAPNKGASGASNGKADK